MVDSNLNLKNATSTGDLALSQIDDLTLYQIIEHNLPEFSDFVFKMYAYHYSKHYGWQPEEAVLSQMKATDQRQFDQSVYFGFRDPQHNLLGTIKATQKDQNLQFAIETEFNVDIDQLIAKQGWVVDQIWHLERLAIDAKGLRVMANNVSSAQLMRTLIQYSLGVINQQQNSLMVAEADTLIYTLFREMGINMQIVGEVQDCLGSPTYPVVVVGADIQQWLALHPLTQ